MPWYRRNSATNTSVAGGINNWRQIANLYRRNSSGNWEQIKRVYRKNSNNPDAYQGAGAWVLVHNSDTLNPYNTITPEFTTDTGRFHDTAKITLTRGTWANTGTAYAPVTYDLDIQYSTDNTNWTNMVTGSGTTLTYTITSNDVSPPSYYFRGRVRAKNSSSVYSGYITVFATERSYRDIDVTYLFTTMNGHNYQASWTLSKTNNSTNVNTQRIEIRTNDYFTHNGTSYYPLDVVYSVTVPAGTGTQQINFLNANIKQNQSYYTELVIIANDSDQTETYEIGDDFIYQGIPVIAPFDITSFTKGNVNGSSQGVTRTTTLNWGAATNASRYSVQYQGRTSNTGEWSDMEYFIPYIDAPTTSDTKTFSSGQTPEFATFIRARIRASNVQGSTMIYNTSDYVEAVGTAPGQPSFGTITKTDTTASIPVTAGIQGSNYRYQQMEYQYRTSPFGSYPSTWSTQALSSGSGTITLSNLSSNQLYYIRIRNKNQDEIYSEENETTFQTNAALFGATSTSIVSMSRLNDTTVRAYIGSSGASGPYYQLFWTSTNTAPSTASYDAASTTTTVMEDFGFSAGTIYFYVRSSSENLGDTTVVGSGTAGTFSSYGPTNGAASYTFVSPSGATSSVSGSSTVGSQLSLTANSPTSAAPTASITSIVWRVNDGGTGGSSFTSGSVLQNGGTTFVIPQYLYGSVSSVGYSIRAEVTWNNGVGSQTANSTGIVVTSPIVKLATPTGVNATDTRTDGSNVTWNAVSGASYYGIWWGGEPGYDTAPDFGGPSNPNLITGTSYLDTAITAGNTRNYYVQAFASGNPAGTKSNWSSPELGGRANPEPTITYGECTRYGEPYASASGYDCIGTYSYAYNENFYYQRRQVLSNGTWNNTYDYSCGNTSVKTYTSYTQVSGQCGYSPPAVAPAIESGPSISWGSGNNYTLSATASNATNLEFQVQYSSSQTGSPSTGSATYFFGASTGGGTTGSQASNRNWARTRVRANNSNTGLSSSFTGYSAWA